MKWKISKLKHFTALKFAAKLGMFVQTSWYALKQGRGNKF
jgi:hypothetical protein